MGSKSSPVSQTTTFTPRGSQLFDVAQDRALQFAANPPSLPDFPLIEPFTTEQTQGQNMVLGAAGGSISDIAGQAANSSRFLSGDVLYPESNPALQGYIDAAIRPITEQFTQSVLPGIRGNAVTTGNFGSSRQGIAEGIASQGYQRAVGDTSAKIASQGYGQGLDAFTKNLQLAPQTQQTQLAPGLATSGVGDVRQALLQAMRGEEASRSTYDEMLPLLIARELTGIGAAMPGGTSTTEATTAKPNPWMQGAGIGLTGLSLLSMLNPATAGIGALGGMLGGLGGAVGGPSSYYGMGNVSVPLFGGR